MKFIDLRSDTVTKPTEEMKQAMIVAEVGDDVYGDDPTINKLEALAAKLLDKEAALFLPSGTMGNQIAIMTHTQHGNEIIVGKNSHIVLHEVGGAAVLSGVNYYIIDHPDGIIKPEDVRSAVREDDIHMAKTGLLCVENALAIGSVVPLETAQAVYKTAKEFDLPVHMDGARIFNAATYLKVDVAEIAACADSIMFCLSKGLCAPVGSMLVGTNAFIEKARKYRKLLGGGMRQAGILAACGLIALNKMTQRLEEDHKNAQYLGEQLNTFTSITVDYSKLHINMVFFTIHIKDFDHDAFVEYMLTHEIKINGVEFGEYRFVTNNDVSHEDIDFIINVMKGFKGFSI